MLFYFACVIIILSQKTKKWGEIMAKNIVLYGKKNCPQCRMMKKFFDENSVIYNYIDIEEDFSALQRVKDLGFSAAPVTEIPLTVMSLQYEADKENSPVKRIGDSYFFSGFRPDLLRSLKIPK